ncbi:MULTISPECIES: hypothetical protein [Streptomyces]|uniref:hypothetical protein n=1 Tax=Streptomyces TaxID=1883 RepID=UPI0022559606|nr:MULTISPECIES: hypothetical protein [Streptomyces]MCX5059169.1 hypothetical protein [Streptomyces sp. NBC_00452]MCZ4506643.1 hypothetical protein [Streptomyces sp. ActVer]WSD90558.1 hypothetical protein OG925_42415 [Streptomyces canus]WSS99459.1 hypothetical protein OG478_51375 [Streptomyces phaeochromogenes]
MTSAEGTAFHLAGLLNGAERTGLGTGPLTDYLVRDETPPSALVEWAARAAGTDPCLTRPAGQEPVLTEPPRGPGKTGRTALVSRQSYV